MITEKRLQEALEYLATTDEEHAKLSAGIDYLKDKHKADKAQFIMTNPSAHLQKSAAMKETAYYSSNDYMNYISEKKDVAYKLNLLENKRAKENLVVDVWRTLEASRRKASV
mgnify:CR=1 FL=1|jgi:hypothetical protein|tara:strand:+ start:263 stop:598 length:336 start_codon:yes stop_codon:yes gene_type:complete